MRSSAANPILHVRSVFAQQIGGLCRDASEQCARITERASRMSEARKQVLDVDVEAKSFIQYS